MHKTRIYDFSKDFKIIRCVVNATRCPWNKSARGRPYEVEPKEYAALIVFMVSKDFSLREADSVSFLLLGKRVAKSIMSNSSQKQSEV